ncbi:MAG: hypothetical protein DI527_00685 [Chelatococcus sp.]|nr:MAG: hypothetical protein DI527_00685 [Chelatococcus sp.]
MRLEISAGDDVLKRFGNRLAAAAERAPTAMARALNHESDKARTQIKRSLAQITGIKPSMISVGFSTRRATASNLTYEFRQRGSETNLNLFRARQGARGVSAAPWNVRRVFPGTFMVPAYGNKVYERSGDKRFPLSPLYGPNLAREIVKGEPRAAFEAIPLRLAARVAHELDFMGL